MPLVANARVLMADTDAMGIVYHGNYLRWFEVGRTELVRACDLPYLELEALGYSLPVVETRLRYRQSARYDDLLAIHAAVHELGRVRVTFRYRILRAADDHLLCEGETYHACLDRAGKVVRFPPRALQALQAALALSPGLPTA